MAEGFGLAAASPAGGGTAGVKVTVGIKALNEAANIGPALESAIAAVEPFGGEVILADCGSSDGTVEIASRFPVRIVQLERDIDKGCGAGAQLAFQFARGDYFYLLDGDMTLDAQFLMAGIAYLEAQPDVAGVGGHVLEGNLAGQEFQVRAQKAKGFDGFVDRLDCGGLYRRKAIEEVGYFADRNLHAFEEFDLGARLAARGWKLARLDRPAVTHFGHEIGGYRLLWRRIRSGYAGGLGEVLKGALGKSHCGLVLRRLWPLQMAFGIVGWWLAILAALATGHWAIAAALVAVPWAILALRRRSPRLGLYSLAAWNTLAIGLLTGLFRRRVSPETPLAARVVGPV